MERKTMKDIKLQEQQLQNLVEENMSNLTSASVEASGSSQTHPVKKKRSLPGNPDPAAEVISLSPKTLLATNRFVCEICNKGFQRDQNLQLHRRGHNLPWKLKQRTSKEIRKKVYVCPESTCVHHHPSRALGDLTGIKKHFCRKHGEKKWKCDKCSKRYAVQSDWKAHSKTCGTREYRCDCGTIFSRRDSFITHRAFCDALAEESAKAITVTPSLPSSMNMMNDQIQLHAFPLKKEIMPSWLAFPGGPYTTEVCSSSSISSIRLDHHLYNQNSINSISNPISSNPNPSAYHLPSPSPHISATALLQKAAQMGSTMSKTGSSPGMVRPHMEVHVSVDMRNNIASGSGSSYGLKLSSREEQNQMDTGFEFDRSLAPFGNKASAVPSAIAGNTAANTVANSTAAAAAYSGFSITPSLLLQGMMMNTLSSGDAILEGTHSFEDGICGVLNSNQDGTAIGLTKKGGHGHGNESLTRDFLSLKPLSHGDVFSIAGMGNCMRDSNGLEQNTQSPKQ